LEKKHGERKGSSVAPRESAVKNKKYGTRQKIRLEYQKTSESSFNHLSIIIFVVVVVVKQPFIVFVLFDFSTPSTRATMVQKNSN
jgi:hypothetical protein